MAKARSVEERRELCEAWRQSGLSKTKFCFMNNISQSNFYSWLKKIHSTEDNQTNKEKIKNKTGNDSTIKFLKIPKIPTALSTTITEELCYLEITLPNRVGLKVGLLPNNMDKFLSELLIWK